MATKKGGLGRGLEALLGSNTARQVAAGAQARAQQAPVPAAPVTPSRPVPAGSSAAPPGEDLAYLPVGALQRGQYQPRSDMREDSLQELADSIRAQGLVQPIVVRPVAVARGEPARYEIIAGERRWRAAQLAGLEQVPVFIRQVADRAAVAMALIENIQRENLNPLEEARALQRLVLEFDITHEEAARAVGRSRAGVSNLLRLLELPEAVRALVEARRLDMGHARALLGLPEGPRQEELARQAAEGSWSVRETEARVRALTTHTPPKPPKPVDPDIRRLENDLSDRLGARVQIRQGAKGSGQLVIDYTSLDVLDGILAHLRAPGD
ncbi:MAG: ParB/RepB/Spo0J family partition protein [Gammaproteobacteria bacterium]